MRRFKFDEEEEDRRWLFEKQGRGGEDWERLLECCTSLASSLEP
jgi:hypothetical protein